MLFRVYQRKALRKKSQVSTVLARRISNKCAVKDVTSNDWQCACKIEEEDEIKKSFCDLDAWTICTDFL